MRPGRPRRAYGGLLLRGGVSQRLRLQRSITYLGAQLIDSFFRLITLGGSGLLPDDIIIIDDSRPIIFPLVVKLRDAK